ncbi:MAG TPA: DUF2795 domain-containing protein [Burkholderiales bacterium]|nr:DUF2795 domain-containing protein [Burkholderiales bacterium]
MARQEQVSGKGQIPNPVQIQKFLHGLDYPVTKQKILDTAKKEGADDNVLNALNQIPDQEYDSPVTVSREVGNLS